MNHFHPDQKSVRTKDQVRCVCWPQCGILGVALMLSGCVGKDVTLDPAIGLGRFRSMCVVTQQAAYVDKESRYAELSIQPLWFWPTLPRSAEEFNALPRDRQFGFSIVPPGTRLRIERLLDDVFNSGVRYHVTGRFLNGKFAGKTVNITYFRQHWDDDPPWTLDEQYLLPCDR